jgi:ubiquinone/menaquinone biosynthesis C-methylase UbiE
MDLVTYLKNRPTFKEEVWVNNLENRKKEEACFHDFKRGNDEKKQKELAVHNNLKFYKTTKNSKKYVRTWLRENVLGKIFLDYACGEGRHSCDVLEHSNPAILVGLDISAGSVQRCIDKTKSFKHPNTYFFQGDCEKTEFPENSFDIILCSEMLHHLQLKESFSELYRILAPGGKILCVEALGINPIIQWYRNHTPQIRTSFEKEHILTLKAFDVAKDIGFTVQNVHFWHLFSIPSAFFLKYPPVFNTLLTIGNVIDSVVLKIPYLQRMAWQFSFILQKPF